MNDNTTQQSFGQKVVNIYAAPAEAFAAIMLAPSWLAPLSMVMLSGLAATGYYFSGLDMAWWVDDTLRQANIEPSELDTARDAMGGMTRGMLFGFGAISTVLFSFLVALVQAMYMSLAAAIMGSVYKFKHWMALASWTSLPYVIGAIAMVVNIALHPNGQLSSYDLDPTSLAALGLTLTGTSFETIAKSVTLTMLWAIGLVTLGFAQWLQISLSKSAAIIATPYILIFGSIAALS
ncbi:MAG: YIP1 family protein [OM182 bacterium]|nr:YIP1 family protein [OM182 bacterium]